MASKANAKQKNIIVAIILGVLIILAGVQAFQLVTNGTLSAAPGASRYASPSGQPQPGLPGQPSCVPPF